MLNLYLIEELAKDLKIAPLNIIREYLEMEVLDALSQSRLATHLIFYGGTALRLAYQSMRFSEDLDFLLTEESKSDQQDLTQSLQSVVTNNQGVVLEEVKSKYWTLFGLLKIKNDLLKHPIRVKVEISKKKNGITDQNLLLISPVSNKEVIFRTVTLTSLLQLKSNAIQNRNMPRDWFDYWYINQKLHQSNAIKKPFPFNSKNFQNDLKRWLPRNKWKILTTVTNFYQGS